VVADLSASMGFAGARPKLHVLADFVHSLAWSAWRTGDSFGFVGCDTTLRDDLYLPQTRTRGAGLLLAERLRGLAAGPGGTGGSTAAATSSAPTPTASIPPASTPPAFMPTASTASRGLLDAHRLLGRQRALLFLMSDFHLPLAEVSQVLASLSAHDVVPVVYWDPQEFSLSAPRGLAHVQDPETGAHRLVWWRPALRERWQAAQRERRDALLQLFRTQRLRPLFVEGAFDADAVTRHFHS
jgi:hypothetical protein